MPRYAIRSIDSLGLVARKYGTNAKNLDEARAHARFIFRNTIPEGLAVANWTGWFVDVIEECGRFSMSVPLCIASEAARHAAEAA
jgi:hypothetical protein